MKDIIKDKYPDGSLRISCLDKGYVEMLDCMPRVVPDIEESIDHAIAEAARCSYQRGTKTIADDKTLIRYLMRHNHTSPFEMIEFKFKMKMPIFVARQFVRTRTANINELSGRYSEMPEEYSELDELRSQSQINKQGSDGIIGVEEDVTFRMLMRSQAKEDFKLYHNMLDNNVCREQARTVLPLSTYTEWYWKIDLKNLLHFLDLRCDSHAQKEIREYADAILKLITPIVPWTIAAWEDYSPYRGGMILTRLEVEKINNLLGFLGVSTIFGVSYPTRTIQDMGKLENREWIEKAKKLGFNHGYFIRDE